MTTNNELLLSELSDIRCNLKTVAEAVYELLTGGPNNHGATLYIIGQIQEVIDRCNAIIADGTD